MSTDHACILPASRPVAVTAAVRGGGKHPPYIITDNFAFLCQTPTMLVKMGVADALLGGATYSTADTVRPALQLIKTKPGNNNVSSCFILQREKDGVDERLCMGDCAIQIDPDEDALVETALECAKTAAILRH